MRPREFSDAVGSVEKTKGQTQRSVQKMKQTMRRLSLVFGLTGLCAFVYLFDAAQNTASIISISSEVSSTTGVVPFNKSSGNHEFPPCDMKYMEYTPCHDPRRAMKFERTAMIYRERHCPAKDELLRCLIPAPPNYKRPFAWPQSRDFAWYDNIPHRNLSDNKAVQNWVVVVGDRFRFPGGGTMFRGGADSYIDRINALIPLTDGSIRTAMDTGCGVGSWGAYLLNRGVLTMSFAPRDSHISQVQFALERGVPAMIGVVGAHRLPYPARAFDMAHCSRCLIPWHVEDGIFLAEVDRVLKPGGFWILSGPPINWRKSHRSWGRTPEDLEKEQDKIEDLAKRLCWDKFIENGEFAIWKKPINHKSCINGQKSERTHAICSGGTPDAAWYKKIEPCITSLPEVSNEEEVAGGVLENWPSRASTVPPRITSGSIPGITSDRFLEDGRQWSERVKHYQDTILDLSAGRYRNVMDMNANLGGFAAALVDYPVWVMNVVPVDSDRDTLGVIYERGFIGTYQDWCEAFSTYPRTYDLLHADAIFSMYQYRCDLEYILLEMDRILRPEGTVLIRDTVEVLLKVQERAEGMKWKTQMTDPESGSSVPWKILVAVKSYWTGVDALETK